jgi:hypothetical protein
MRRIRQKFHSEQGATIIMLIAVAAVLAGITVSTTKLYKTQQSSMTHTNLKTRESSILQGLEDTLISKAACRNSFLGVALGSEVTQIKDSRNSNTFHKDLVIDSSVKIIEMRLESNSIGANNAVLSVKLERQKTAHKGVQIPQSLEVPLSLELNASNEVTDCLSTFVNSIGDTMTGQLLLPSLRATNQICIDGNCRTTFAIQNCPAGEVLTTLNTDGTLNCSRPPYLPISCAAPQLVRGIDANAGTATCAFVSWAQVAGRPGNQACSGTFAVQSVNFSTGAVTCVQTAL